ncbi:Uncharacterised protein [Sphingobacterium thalpophilum]|uniref:Uncharacterized protein n=1 Tax=Sphingobacterium thalpophilum TaxID=259 RepID=A0A4U9UP20_9SPHI|nr:Uncharacterised protein [Sphingobacterium thalpophilum]
MRKTTAIIDAGIELSCSEDEFPDHRNVLLAYPDLDLSAHKEIKSPDIPIEFLHMFQIDHVGPVDPHKLIGIKPLTEYPYTMVAEIGATVGGIDPGIVPVCPQIGDLRYIHLY